MKNKNDDNYIKTNYSAINYVIINNNKQYLSGNIDKHKLYFTYRLNEARKFYKYEDALLFANNHHMKCYKIHKVEFSLRLLKEV